MLPYFWSLVLWVIAIEFIAKIGSAPSRHESQYLTFNQSMKTTTMSLGFVLTTLASSTVMAAVSSGELIKAYLEEEGIESRAENGMLIFTTEGATMFVRDLSNKHIIKILVPCYVSGVDSALLKRECQRLNNEMAVLKFLPNKGYVAISYEGLIPEKSSKSDIKKIINFLAQSQRMLHQLLQNYK